jgi:hypothetical protein
MADAAARLFYDRLEIDPTTRPLFKTNDLADQRRKLIQALTMVVQGLDHLEALVPTIADLADAMHNSESRPFVGCLLSCLRCASAEGEAKLRPRLRRRSDAPHLLQTSSRQARGTVEGHAADTDPVRDTSSAQPGRLQRLKQGWQC